MRAATLPCRQACWAVIGVYCPGFSRSGTAAASPHANTSGWPGTRRYGSTSSRPRSSGRPMPSTSGSGRTPTHHTSVRVSTNSPSLSRTPVGRRLLHGRPGPHLDAPLPQHAVGGTGQPLVQLGQYTRRDVEQHPARPYALPQGPLAHQRVGEQLPVGGDFGARVTGADHHEGAPRGTALRVVGGGGELHLPRHVVAQVQRLGQPAEAVRVLGDTGDGQQLVDAADGEHQPVVRQRAAVALGVGVVHGVRVEVDAVGLAEHEPYVRQGAGSETVTRRGSSTPAATWGSSGRYRK